MSKTTVVTARLNSDIVADLDRLATHYDRSRAWLISNAVDQYVKQESEFVAFVKKGDDDIDKDDVFSQEQMEDWSRSLQRVDRAA